MLDRPAGTITDYLRRFVASSLVKDAEDGQLLDRFTGGRDEAAFAAFIHRYGPLVYGLCRRVTGDVHQAEDAFQATFLVFVRKATAIRKRSSVGSWLYAVAFRAAMQARRAARHPVPSKAHSAENVPDPADEVMSRELRSVLDEEVNRLPEKIQVPFRLCYLEGKTFDEAARQLCCPLGTISTRLAKAREQLRSRLTRRGITFSTATVTAALAETVAPAVPPTALVDATVKIALSVVSGQTLQVAGTAGPVIALSEGVLRTMLMNRIKIALGIVVLVVGFATASGWMIHRSVAGDPASEKVSPSANQPEGRPAEAESIIGTWAVVSFEGKNIPALNNNWRITPNRILIRTEEMGYQLNRGRKLYEIDILEEQKVVIVGIIDIQGRNMKMCLADPPNRPTEFTAPANSGRLLIVFKREDQAGGPDKLRSLLKDRFQVAGEEFAARNQQFLAGRGTDEFLYQSARRLLEAERELPDKSAVTALTNHLRRMTAIEEASKTRFEAGRIAVQDYRSMQYWKLEAEIWLERALQAGGK
jgi:RNA polymerase sigma factor (sigma-70 family)